MEGAYEQVGGLCRSGKLRLIGITSPARCASTTLEVALAGNVSVDGLVNQPFGLSYYHPDGRRPNAEDPYHPPADREGLVYQKILERYHKICAEHPAKKDGAVVLVVKEMTRNLGFSDMYERYQALLDKEILLIRNPVLSTDSSIKKLLLELSPLREGLFDCSAMNALAAANDCGQGLAAQEAWRGLKKRIDRTGEFRLLEQDGVLQGLGLAYDLNTKLPGRLQEYVNALTDSVAQDAGYASLNAYARGVGQDDWAQLKKTVAGRSLTMADPLAGPILRSLMETSVTGWFNMAKLTQKSKGKPGPAQMVVDATLLRLDPVQTLKTLFSECKLDGTISDKLHPAALAKLAEDIGDEEDARNMHGRALSSSRISPPHEPCPRLDQFPPRWQNHITQVALPSYLSLLKHAIGRPRSRADMESLATKPCANDVPLMQFDPVSCYAFAAAAEIQASKNTLKAAHPLYTDAFTSIDRANTRILS